MTEETKAQAIEKRHKHQCAICMLIDTDNLAMEWHVFSEAVTRDEEDKEICEGCRKDLVEVRKRCDHKADNPNHDTFKDFMPGFVKDMPGLKEAFKKILS